MSRSLLLGIAATTLFAVGCVPVTEPVGDIDKAKPDEKLVGTWAPVEKTPEMNKLKIEMAPQVKGNPKGLMVMTFLGYPFPKDEVRFFFFLTVVGKEQYGNMLLDATDKLRMARLEKADEYAKWSKGTGRRYAIFRCAATKDGLTLNFGDEDAFKTLMKDEKIEPDDVNIGDKDKKLFAFKTPKGWLERYLEKNGRDKLFPVAKDAKHEKAK